MHKRLQKSRTCTGLDDRMTEETEVTHASLAGIWSKKISNQWICLGKICFKAMDREA